VMDISLHGGENGLDLTRRIRADARFGRLPVIAVTAHAFPRDRDNSLAAGCDDYLSKPFRRNELRELIARLLKDRKT
jgi:CheY-like chemotaxis protein